MPVVLLAPISLIGSLGVGAMIGIAHFCATLPFASVTLPEPFNVVAALASGALIALHRRSTIRHAACQPKRSAQESATGTPGRRRECQSPVERSGCR